MQVPACSPLYFSVRLRGRPWGCRTGSGISLFVGLSEIDWIRVKAFHKGPAPRDALEMFGIPIRTLHLPVVCPALQPLTGSWASSQNHLWLLLSFSFPGG